MLRPQFYFRMFRFCFSVQIDFYNLGNKNLQLLYCLEILRASATHIQDSTYTFLSNSLLGHEQSVIYYDIHLLIAF